MSTEILNKSSISIKSQTLKLPTGNILIKKNIKLFVVQRIKLYGLNQ